MLEYLQSIIYSFFVLLAGIIIARSRNNHYYTSYIFGFLIFTFAVPFFIGGIIELATQYVYFENMTEDLTSQMSSSINLASFSTLLSLVGYILSSKKHSKFRSIECGVNIRLARVEAMCYATFLCSTLAKFIEISNGTFGYYLLADAHGISPALREVISIISSLDLLSLFFLFFTLESNNNSKRKTILSIIMVITSVSFGLVSGMKTNAIAPIVIILCARIIKTRKVNPALILTVVATIIFTYKIIQDYRFSSIKDTTDSYSQTINNYLSASPVFGSKELIGSFLERISYVRIASKALDYEIKGNSTTDPDFTAELTYGILTGLIPRLFYPEKQVYNHGEWYNKSVLGHSHHNVIAFTHFIYLYFSGPIFFVLFSLATGLVIGVIENSRRKIPNQSIITPLHYFLFYYPISFINSALPIFFISIIKSSIALIFIGNIIRMIAQRRSSLNQNHEGSCQ